MIYTYVRVYNNNNNNSIYASRPVSFGPFECFDLFVYASNSECADKVISARGTVLAFISPTRVAARSALYSNAVN